LADEVRRRSAHRAIFIRAPASTSADDIDRLRDAQEPSIGVDRRGVGADSLTSTMMQRGRSCGEPGAYTGGNRWREAAEIAPRLASVATRSGEERGVRVGARSAGCQVARAFGLSVRKISCGRPSTDGTRDGRQARGPAPARLYTSPWCEGRRHIGRHHAHCGREADTGRKRKPQPVQMAAPGSLCRGV